jgi:gliding motility-associated-like protein
MKKSIAFIAVMTSLFTAAHAQLLEDGSWTWMKGSDTVKKNAIVGTQGVPDPANDGGSRSSAGTWTDAAGNFWVFGGRGFRTVSTIPNYINDLWRYNPGTNEWTWVNGDSTLNGAGFYGAKGVSSPQNQPPNRYRFPTWTDNQGNLWLFGGTGNTGNRQLSDLWKYNIASNEWTWMAGQPGQNVNGLYNNANPGAFPGAREGASGWMDNNGNFWIYGGYGRAASNTAARYLSDLWKYDLATARWTWVHGDSSTNVLAVYGTKGVAAPTNKPGNRRYASYWNDDNGNLWMFGGECSSTGALKRMNDLWMYSPNTNEWTWVSGDSTANETGVYGTRLQPDAANKPGGRAGCGFWKEPDGKRLWLFGGSGYGATSDGYLNDLWLYTIATNEWVWVSGDTAVNTSGVYGTQGVPDPANVPGGRYTTHGGWSGGKGKLWLYGGDGRGKNPPPSMLNAMLNDVWKFEICFALDDLAAIDGPDTVCRNTTITYAVPPVDGADGYAWSLPAGWSGSSTTEQITVTAGNTGGTITVKAFNYCDTSTVSMNVVIPVPQTGSIDKARVCPNEVFRLQADDPLPSGNYKWYLNDYTQNIGNQPEMQYSLGQPGNYTILLVASDGYCSDTVSFSVTVVQNLELQLTASRPLINYGEDVTLSTQGNVPYQVTQWLPQYLFPDQAALNQTFRPDSSRRYQVFAKSSDGCADSATVVVNINPVVFVPGAFSPNGDGKNDYFKPLTMGDDITINHMRVFNRFGELVYSAYGQHSYSIKGWDGTFKDKPADIGTYFYDMKLSTPYGKEIVQKGDVTLIR